LAENLRRAAHRQALRTGGWAVRQQVDDGAEAQV